MSDDDDGLERIYDYGNDELDDDPFHNMSKSERDKEFERLYENPHIRKQKESESKRYSNISNSIQNQKELKKIQEDEKDEKYKQKAKRNYDRFKEDFDILSDEDLEYLPDSSHTAVVPAAKSIFEIELDETNCNIVSLVNNALSSHELIEIEQRRDELGLTPLYKCSGIPGHESEAQLICFNIIESLSKFSTTIEIIKTWCRNQIFPQSKFEVENRMLLIYILFANIDLTLEANTGILLFESFTFLSQRLQLKPEFQINKYRFGFSNTYLTGVYEDDTSNIKLFSSSCFYVPQAKTISSFEIKNFAHNDFLNEYSFKLRKNLVISLIFFRLRTLSHDKQIFNSFQKDFYNSFIYISFLIYNKMSKESVNPFIPNFVKEMTSFILDINLYDKMRKIRNID